MLARSRIERTPQGQDGGVDVRLYQDDTDSARCSLLVFGDAQFDCGSCIQRFIGGSPYCFAG